MTCYTIWVRPADVKKTEEKDAAKQKAEIEKKTKDVSKTLSETLDMDYDEVYKMVTKEQSIVKVKKGVSKDVAEDSESLTFPEWKSQRTPSVIIRWEHLHHRRWER